jgi:hypothetical protein
MTKPVTSTICRLDGKVTFELIGAGFANLEPINESAGLHPFAHISCCAVTHGAIVDRIVAGRLQRKPNNPDSHLLDL